MKPSCARTLLLATFQLLVAAHPWSMVQESSAALSLLGNCFLGDRGAGALLWIEEEKSLNWTSPADSTACSLLPAAMGQRASVLLGSAQQPSAPLVLAATATTRIERGA